MIKKIEKDGYWLIEINASKQILSSPKGAKLLSKSEAFIDETLMQLEDYDDFQIEKNAISGEVLIDPNYYSLYSGANDFRGSLKVSKQEFSLDLSRDPVLHVSLGPEAVDQLKSWHFVNTYFEELGIKDNITSSGLHYSDEEGLGVEFYSAQLEGSDFIRFEIFCERIYQDYCLLDEYSLVVLNTLNVIYGSITLALCLIRRKCTSDEFAFASFPIEYLVIPEDVIYTFKNRGYLMDEFEGEDASQAIADQSESTFDSRQKAARDASVCINFIDQMAGD